MRMVLLVAAGGAVGAVLRYGLSGLVQGRTGAVFPYGTLAVNVVGCLLMGVISELAESRGALEPGTRALITVGVLGGFTTFSAFGNETLNLLRDGERALAAGNVAANLILALAAVWAGRAAAAGLWR